MTSDLPESNFIEDAKRYLTKKVPPDVNLTPKERAYVIGLLAVAAATAKREGCFALADWFNTRIAALAVAGEKGTGGE